MTYSCHLCGSENEVTQFGKNICNTCHTRNIIMKPDEYEKLRLFLESMMQRASDSILINVGISSFDNQSVKNAKFKTASANRKFLNELQTLIEENGIEVDVVYDKIQGNPELISSCQMDTTKICTGCGDC